MKQAAERHLPVLVIALAILACGKTAVPAPLWAAERSATKGGVSGVVRVSATTLTPGARLDCEFTVTASATTVIDTPEFQAPGMETVEFTAMPVSLDPGENVLHTFRWTIQAGPPGNVEHPKVSMGFKTGQAAGSLVIGLPEILIRSAFEPGESTDKLPPMEEHDAL